MPMVVQKTELTGANQGTISCLQNTGSMPGTFVITANKTIVKAVDPGDTISITFNKV